MADKLPIPETDAQIETYVVCWPQTDAWEGILTGFISMPASPDFWDEETGSIDDVLELGQQILALNAAIAEREVTPMTCLIPFGADPLAQSEQTVTLSSGNEVRDFGPVVGEVWLVTQVSATNLTFQNSLTRLSVVADSNEQFLRQVINPPPTVPVTVETIIPIANPDRIRIRFNGHGISDTLRFGVFGWKWQA